MLRSAQYNDLEAIAAIDRLSFSGNRAEGAAARWYGALFNRSDQYQVFVWEQDGRVVAFIGWELLGGFARALPVLELQKLATHPSFRSQGIATRLVKESFEIMKEWVRRKHPGAKSMRVVVWVARHNESAKKVYRAICSEDINGERDMYGMGKEEVMLRGEYGL